MRGLLAVGRREIVERRMVLEGAVFASLVPIAVPLARGLSGADASDARRLTALIVSAAFAAGTAIVLGATMLAPKIANRRIAFDLARPLSAFALWFGRLAAAALLAIVSAAIVWLPSWIVGGSTVHGDDLPVTLPVGLLLVLAVVVVLFALFHAATVAVLSRSAMIVLDAGLALAMGYGVSAALARLPLFMGPWISYSAAIAFAVFTAAALLVAGYVSVARGRADIRAAHRALSLGFWITVLAGVLGAIAYTGWVMASKPDDLRTVSSVIPAPAGPWVSVSGSARGAAATFLYDTATGRYAKGLGYAWWGWPIFSADGRRAVWVDWQRKGARPIWTLDLADPAASPIRTRLLVNGSPSLAALTDDGSRLATVEKGILSIHDLAASRTLVSARVAAEDDYPRGFFVSRELFRLYRMEVLGPEKMVLKILELDVSARRLEQTGSFSLTPAWCSLVVNRSGNRLIVEQNQTKQVWLLDAHSGRLLSILAAALPGNSRPAGFLADGRVVLSDSSPDGRVLRVFTCDGAPSAVVPFPGAKGLALGGEAAPGQLVVAVGEGMRRRIDLVDVDGGQRREVGEDLFPAARLSAFWNRPNESAAVGSDATRLFYRSEETLIRLDPLTGKRKILLGKDAR